MNSTLHYETATFHFKILNPVRYVLSFAAIWRRFMTFAGSGWHSNTVWTTPYLLTPWCRVLLEKLTGLQLVKKFPAFLGTGKFITAVTSVRHLSLSWASPIQSIYPHPTSWTSILILSTHLCVGLPSGVLPSGYLSKTLYNPFSSPIRATCPAHLILLDFITRTILGEEYKPFSSSFWTTPTVVYCSHFCPYNETLPTLASTS